MLMGEFNSRSHIWGDITENKYISYIYGRELFQKLRFEDYSIISSMMSQLYSLKMALATSISSLHQIV